jgi:uncharacterized protein YjbJ (UPF0337 family)
VFKVHPTGYEIRFITVFGLSRRTGTIMGIVDELKARVKEAAGALSGNKKLKRDGKADHVAGKTKDIIDNASRKANDAVDAARGDYSKP